MSELTKKIRTRGYTHVSIHPARFAPDRVKPITSLLPIIERCKVSVRGWDFPHLSRREPEPVPELDSIGQESEWNHHLERWRIYQTGQFVSLRGLSYDWRDQSGFWPPERGWRSGELLPIEDALFTFVEIFEFAARLSNTAAGDDPVQINVTFGGMRGRSLATLDPRRMDFVDRPRARIDTFPQRRIVPRTQLLAEPRELAVEGAQDLFRRFGEELPTNLLRDWIAELIRR